jgi:ferritin
MEFENLTAILDFAIENELEAAEFYTTISKEETFSGAGKMFEEFSREERKHQQLLEDFKVLCQEEAKHKLALETMYDDYMAEMGD